MARRPHVAVVGGGQLDDDLVEAGRLVGGGLAAAGVVVVCGGLGDLMEATCAGVAGEGGTSVAVLPDPDRSGAVDASVVLPTGLGEARNAVIARSADAVVAIGGGFGTLSEIALALRAGIPVVGYRTWGVAPPPGVDAEDPLLRVDSPDDAVALATGIVGAGPPQSPPS